jgi:hypothetical protein
MRAAILSLITAAALLATTSTADARPFRHWGGYRGYNSVRFFPSYNTSPYYGGYYGYRSWGYPSYYSYGYPGYYGYPSYYGGYGGYYNPGLFLNVGGLGLSIGSGLPYYGGYWW